MDLRNKADSPGKKPQACPIVEPPEIEIRLANSADARTIAHLSGQLGYPTAVRQAERRLEAILGSKDHAVFVAHVDKQILGWIHVFLAQRIESEPFAELGGLVIAELHRRRGIGRRLLARAEEWSVGCGVAKLRVRVRVRYGRDEARAFYQGLGFTQEKEQGVFDKSWQISTLDSPSP